MLATAVNWEERRIVGALAAKKQTRQGGESLSKTGGVGWEQAKTAIFSGRPLAGAIFRCLTSVWHESACHLQSQRKINTVRFVAEKPQRKCNLMRETIAVQGLLTALMACLLNR
ncbi:hypothetical protein [Quatrionicoccus australiensis]|uniref:hypothetical protein n=1 Tax=Quatrionicoccus australiensis TaxID=138118 RepID=UPI001CF925C7|nr:hypothetical protein [Quatrionicoccus australiensis]UCV16923.1 hypothetical protein KI612_09750 [Quatrionicoccus australiensis]